MPSTSILMNRQWGISMSSRRTTPIRSPCSNFPSPTPPKLPCWRGSVLGRESSVRMHRTWCGILGDQGIVPDFGFFGNVGAEPLAVAQAFHVADPFVTDGIGRVASGGCPPEAPTDPYVLALEHTVPQI